MKKKLIWFMVSSLVVASLVITSCAAPAEEEVEEEKEEEWVSEIEEEEEVEEVSLVASKEPVYGGSLTISCGSGESFDPVGGRAGQAAVFPQVMDRLGEGDWAKGPGGTNECLMMSPMFDYLKCGRGFIIESWEQTGPLTYVGHVRPGIKFNACLPHVKAIVQDRELIAEDIYYCWDRALNWPGRREGMAQYLESINVVDRYTIEYVLSKPYFNVVGSLFSGRFIYPREPVDEFGDYGDWHNLCGSGPFIVTDFISDASWTVQKNPDYWRYDELNPEYQLPYLDTVRGLIIMDRMTQLSALRTGKLDVLWRVTPDEIKTLEVSNPELQWRQAPQDDSRPIFHMRLDEPPLDDARIRRALVMAINMQEIVDSLYEGDGEPFVQVACSIWPDWYVPREELPEDIQEIWSYNPVKARELLDEALGPGAELEFDVGCVAGYVDQVAIFQAQWNAIGINANIATMEHGSMQEQLRGETYHGMIAQGGVIRMPYQEAMGPQDFHPGENYEDPIWEAMIEEMQVTIDPDEQWTIYEQARNHLLRNPIHIRFPHPYIRTYWQPWIGGYHGEFTIGGSWSALYARIWCDTTVKTAMGR